MRNVYDFQQSSSAGLNAACVAAHTATGDANKCIFAQWSSAHIKTPTFPLQSQYDASCFVFLRFNFKDCSLHRSALASR